MMKKRERSDVFSVEVKIQRDGVNISELKFS
jgi:hypothetical protein